MSGRRQYPAKRRALTYLQLVRNDWNIARTAGDVHVPEQTVRDWAKKWKDEGPEQDILEPLADGADEFLDDAERVRAKAMNRLEAIVGDSTSVRELTVAIGILTDKIERGRGLRDLTRPELPAGVKAPKELIESVGEAVIGAIAQAAQRRQEIVEAEVVEPAPRGLLTSLTEE